MLLGDAWTLLHRSITNSWPKADAETPPAASTVRAGRREEENKGRSAVSFSLKVMSAQFLPIVSAYMQQNRYCHRGNWEMWLSIQLGFPEEVFPGASDGKESACHAGDPGLIPGLGRSPGGGHGSPLQYSGLENPMDRGTWWATVHGLRELDVTERLNTAEYIWIDKMGILSEYM